MRKLEKESLHRLRICSTMKHLQIYRMKILNPKIRDQIVGYHDGLFCMLHSPTNRLTIWNPETREFRNLPNYKYCNSSNHLIVHSTFIGFEFDLINNDFKLLFAHNLWNEKR